MTPSIAAGRAGKARLFEHMDVRVRAGARPARSAGQSSQPDVGETVMPAPMALVTFPERKVTRAVGRRGKRHGCRASTCLVGLLHQPPSTGAAAPATSGKGSR